MKPLYVGTNNNNSKTISQYCELELHVLCSMVIIATGILTCMCDFPILFPKFEIKLPLDTNLMQNDVPDALAACITHF